VPDSFIESGTLQIIDNSEEREPTERRASVEAKSSSPYITYCEGEELIMNCLSFEKLAPQENKQISIDIIFQEAAKFELILFVTYKVLKSFEVSGTPIEFVNE
jgi:hypothetical protein